MINIQINKKSIIMLSILLSFFTIANYVSVVDAESNGGVTVLQEQAPVGSVIMWGGSTPPTDWLEMNGQSTAGYSELASIYGANLPDLRGEFVRGWDNGKGTDSGRDLLSSQTDMFKSHTHTQKIPLDGVSGGDMQSLTSTSNADENWRTHGTTNATGGTETRPRNIALMYIVKAK